MQFLRRLSYLVPLLSMLVVTPVIADSDLQLSERSRLYKHLASELDQNDLARVEELLDAGPDAQADRWRNPISHNVYTIQIADVFDTAAGPCRAFDISAWLVDRRLQIDGLACRRHGHWRIVE
ncbi:hypothetical protein [Hydrocarboniphaga sp.]|uniref:hypothetical protein n=1 Tax=Hydrocarboniphaga sp. TaxID=2033016 RepID=UPI003D138E1E